MIDRKKDNNKVEAHIRTHQRRKKATNFEQPKLQNLSLNTDDYPSCMAFFFGIAFNGTSFLTVIPTRSFMSIVSGAELLPSSQLKQ